MVVGIVVAAVVVWVAAGLLVRLALIRRGHLGTSVGAAVLAGPFLLMALVQATGKTVGPAQVLAPGAPGSGGLSVVVGVDGSPEAEAAARTAVEVLGSAMGRLALVTVVGFDYRDAGERQAVEHESRTRLAAMAESITQGLAQQGQRLEPVLVVASGEPAAALVDAAAQHQADLLVVGRRGAGISKILLGSVATHLAQHSPVPLLVVGP